MFHPAIISVIGLIVIGLISVPLAKNLSQKYKVNDQVLSLQQEISEIEGENRQLDKMINYLDSEQFKEGQARLNLGLKKTGESVTVIQFEDKNTIVEQTKSDQEDNEIEKSNPKKWFKYFFAAKDIALSKIE
ncbi:septum formation initiator family protein [Patescibacteria group bacterium]|nr:septum formation initiator family protein [Patescibacteria group bacterium]